MDHSEEYIKLLERHIEALKELNVYKQKQIAVLYHGNVIVSQISELKDEIIKLTGLSVISLYNASTEGFRLEIIGVHNGK